MLGEALQEPFKSYNDILPNRKAWAVQLPYTDKEKELEVYTNCTALSNGWVWNIPLWNRIGTGYVYSDEFTTDEEALQEFKDHLNSDKMTVPNTIAPAPIITILDILILEQVYTNVHGLKMY